jgi:hypothetical protein
MTLNTEYNNRLIIFGIVNLMRIEIAYNILIANTIISSKIFKTVSLKKFQHSRNVFSTKKA